MARAADFWVFGNDSNLTSPKVTILLPNDKIISIEPETAVTFGEYVWISEWSGDDAAIIGISVQSSATNKVEFYKIVPANDDKTVGYKSFKIPAEIAFSNASGFASGNFRKSHFSYSPTNSAAPMALPFCHPTEFFNKNTKQC